MVVKGNFVQHLTDKQLVEEYLREESQEAFTVLAQRHGGLVFSTCYRLLNNSADAEDAAQVVFSPIN